MRRVFKHIAPSLALVGAVSLLANVCAADDDPQGELSAIIINEISRERLSQAIQAGIEGNRDFRRVAIDGVFTIKREDGKLYWDEGRFALKAKLKTKSGHEFRVGPAVWKDLTIDANTKVAGVEAATKGPFKTELAAGGYAGTVDVLGTNGRLIQSWVQIERKLGPVELTFESFNGKIRGTGDPSALGTGRFSKHEIKGEIDLRDFKATHLIPIAISAKVEKKHTAFGAYGPNQSETIALVGVRVPLTGWSKLRHRSMGAPAN
jgi:hypothetical protein